MHRDVVYGYPAETVPLGWSAGCDVQGMLIPQRAITVQGHPEFDEGIVRELLEARHEQKIIDDAVFEDGLRRVSRDHDGVTVAVAFLKFLLDGR